MAVLGAQPLEASRRAWLQHQFLCMAACRAALWTNRSAHGAMRAGHDANGAAINCGQHTTSSRHSWAHSVIRRRPWQHRADLLPKTTRCVSLSKFHELTPEVPPRRFASPRCVCPSCACGKLCTQCASLRLPPVRFQKSHGAGLLTTHHRGQPSLRRRMAARSGQPRPWPGLSHLDKPPTEATPSAAVRLGVSHRQASPSQADETCPFLRSTCPQS